MEELWRPTPYPNYEVSNLGNVRNVSHGVFGHKLSEPALHGIHYTKKGYARVMLCIDGHQKNVGLATLVANAFLGEQPKGCVVSYKDDDRKNCCADNLMYTTMKDVGKKTQARNYALNGDNSTIGRRMARQKKTEEKYQRALDAYRLHCKEGLSLKVTAEMLGLSESGVSRLLNGSHNSVLEKAMEWVATSAREPHR